MKITEEMRKDALDAINKCAEFRKKYNISFWTILCGNDWGECTIYEQRNNNKEFRTCKIYDDGKIENNEEWRVVKNNDSK